MRRAFVLSFALLLIFAPTSGAADPHIAAGVSVAGVDLSGLSLGEASSRLASTLAPRAGTPLSTHVAGHRFALAPADLDYGVDWPKTARRAYNAGQAQHTGPVAVPLFITYDAKKLSAYSSQVATAVARPARDATLKIGITKLTKVASRDGRAVDANAVEQAVVKRLGDPRLDRVVTPALRVVKPKVTTAGLASAYGTVITIDRANFKLRLFKRLKLSKTYRVAVGQPAYPTPTGRFSIANKAVNPTWSVPNSPWAGALANETVPGGSDANPLKARWMGIANGVGIHGTSETGSIGTRASHGCIRMTVPDVVDLYPRVPVGTPVLIGN